MCVDETGGPPGGARPELARLVRQRSNHGGVAAARSLGVIGKILQAKLTDVLWGDDRSDEAQVGASPPELEWVMARRDAGRDTRTTHLNERQLRVSAMFDGSRAANRRRMEAVPVRVIRAELRT